MTTETTPIPSSEYPAEATDVRAPALGLATGSASGFRVRFENVGACKRSWETTLKRIDFDTLYREVKKRGGIMSRGVDFTTDDDARTGSIFVGVFRCVGTFSWQNIGGQRRAELARPKSQPQ